MEARNSIKSLVAYDQHHSNEKRSNGTVNTTRTSNESILGAYCVDAPQDKDDAFDRIIVASELEDTHSERREPNGTSYFVERRTSEDRALQILDSAIELIPEESLQTPGAMSSDEIEPPIETIVLVHRVGDAPQLPPEKLDNEDADSGILVVSQMSLNDPKSSKYDLNESEDATADRSVGHPMISHVAGTKTLPHKRTHKNEREKINTLGHVKPSRSDTDLRTMLFEEIKRFRRSGDDDEEFSDPIAASEPSNGTSPVQALSPTIPEPPLFDQEKFDQIGGTIPRPKLIIGTVKRKAPNPPISVEIKSSVQSLPDELAESTLTKSSPNFTSFKNKLEAIYSQGPPSAFVKPNKLDRSFSSAEYPASPSATETSPEQELKLAKLNLKPIDTVHRQKLIFNDVLKAMSDIQHETQHN